MGPNFDLANIALQSVCPNNILLYDDVGLPSVMVRVPKMTYAELGLGSSTDVFPAWIINGTEIDEIYISKYQNCCYNGRAYSLPARDPQASINFDTSRDRCEAKGAGWHLMTRMEWMAVALWCKKNGTMPKGNNNYGKDSSESIYSAIPTMARDSSGRRQRVATGTGPLTWSHDGTPAGIWDLNGNVYEWVGGIRTVYGELQVLANNNAADLNHSQAVASDQWMAIDATTGLLITPNGSGTTTNSLKIDYVSNKLTWTGGALQGQADTYRAGTLESVLCDESVSDAAKLMLQALGMFKYDTTSGAYGGDYVYFNNGTAERAFYCGGHWYAGAGAGVFCAGGNGARSGSVTYLGFRSAFCKRPTV